jgi:hypothetical protein
MSKYIMIHVNLSKQFYKQLHDLMGMEILDEDDNIRFQFHKGSKQQFYRELLELGMNEKYKQFHDKKKELEAL